MTLLKRRETKFSFIDTKNYKTLFFRADTQDIISTATVLVQKTVSGEK